MSIQKFQLKLYVENGDALDIEKIIPVFHAFIREKKVSEMVIDVADYGHVAEGPGIVLIGHASDYYIEQREGRVGLLYSRKRDFVGDTEAALASAAKLLLEMAAALEGEESLGIRFGLGELQLRVNDRLNAPNDAATFASLSPTITKVLGKVLGSDVTLANEGEPRDMLTVRVRGGKGSVADARARVA